MRSTREIAQEFNPDARIVYVDNDPLVMTHARALLNDAGVTTGHIEADLTDPGTLLDQARAVLDFTQPVAVMLMHVLGHIGDPARDDDRTARTIVQAVKDALPAGSVLVISEIAGTGPAAAAALACYSQSAAIPYHPRRPSQIAGLFDGLQLIEPGIVPISRWQPDPSPFTPPAVPAWGGAGITRC
jgi:predicted O-methyltransferase YrrM